MPHKAICRTEKYATDNKKSLYVWKDMAAFMHSPYSPYSPYNVRPGLSSYPEEIRVT
jgi:hypothetical protein